MPGGRLLTALGKATGLTRVGTRGLAAGSSALASARTGITRMTTAVRDGLGRRVPVLGPESGSAS